MCPGRSVERPGIIEISPAIISAEHDYFSADRIVGHREVGTRRRRCNRGKLRPGWSRCGGRSSGGYKQGNANAYAPNKRTRKTAKLIKSHNAEFKPRNRCIVKPPNTPNHAKVQTEISGA